MTLFKLLSGLLPGYLPIPYNLDKAAGFSIQRKVPPPLMNAAYRIMRARVGVRATDPRVFELQQLLFVVSRGRCSVFVNSLYAFFHFFFLTCNHVWCLQSPSPATASPFHPARGVLVPRQP